MGQRHQVYIIARIRGRGSDSSSRGRYRCIFAWHHQWCYGYLPLLGAHRFFTLLKNPDNAEIVRWELDHIQGLWADDESLTDVLPCPYTGFLLGTSWNVDLEGNVLSALYSSGTEFENDMMDPNMGSSHGHNNDGITILDITDPSAPAYCFVSIHGLEAANYQGRDFVPMAAKDYCRAYLPAPAPAVLKKNKKERRTEANIKKTIALFDDVPLIKQSSLAEAWPAEYRLEESDKDKGEDEDAPAEEAERAPKASDDVLVTAAIAALIQGGDSGKIEGVLLQRDRRNAFRTQLCKLRPFPDELAPFLAKVFREEEDNKYVDLAGSSLDTNQLCQLLPEIQAVEVLNLSKNPYINTGTLLQILPQLPNLRRLVLLGCSGIPPHDLKAIIAEKPELFDPLDAIIHSLFLSRASSLPYNPRFAIRWVSYKNHRGNQLFTMPTFNLARIIQTLIDLLRPLTIDDSSFELHGHNAESVEAALTGGLRRAGEPWSARTVTYVARPVAQHDLPDSYWEFSFMHSMSQNRGWAFVHQRRLPKVIDKQANPSAEGATSPARKGKQAWDSQIYDLKGFLEKVRGVGDRHSAPSDEAVEELQSILDKLAEDRADLGVEGYPFLGSVEQPQAKQAEASQ
ncbi:hypothetical protein EVG20_g4221 [Dentipellis fragilis]|uniref:Uncharacterized protein n=1 Tax=Dentipellis fragilis TaxID=205917 RepID=A0A4Y9Z0G3_9AGAM|nr:hypothetical protein EVG20_g4221 [Dentipellis fragilis]